jgi:hypothetical protein
MIDREKLGKGVGGKLKMGNERKSLMRRVTCRGYGA